MPRDRSLSLTINNNIHSLSPSINPTLRLHHLHIFLNPYQRMPYLLYTCDGRQHTTDAVTTRRFTITTSLPSSLIPSKRPKRRHMTRATSHTPDLGTVLTFPADSVQHQMTILTLATQMLLTIPVIHAPHMVWKIIRQPHTHLRTLHLILATIALKRYHPILFTDEATPTTATPSTSGTIVHSHASGAPASRTQPTSPPIPSPTQPGTEAQLLLPSLISPNPSTKRHLPPGTVITKSLRPCSSKRQNIHDPYQVSQSLTTCPSDTYHSHYNLLFQHKQLI